MNVVDEVVRESLQSKKQDLVRSEIWHAAIELFVADGFDAVTVEQIAARAGVSRRTFFRYYGSKDELMSASVKGYGKALCAALGRLGGELGVYEAGRRAVAQVLAGHGSVERAERFLQIGRRSAAALGAQSLQIPVVEAELAMAFAGRAGREEPSLDDRIAATLTFAMTKLCVEGWVGEPGRAVGEIVEEVFGRLSAICES